MTDKISVMDVYKLLPKTNCKKCGEPNCMGFSIKLVGYKITLDKCTPLFEEPKYAANVKKLQGLFPEQEVEGEGGIIIDEDKCTGCGNCLVACPPNARMCEYCKVGNGPPKDFDNLVFKIKNGKAIIINEQKCRRFEPPILACRVCETYCFGDAIKIVGFVKGE
ncbi:MAG: (Fe-S)-binding protein [Candidatus Helarchaeota archaeon]